MKQMKSGNLFIGARVPRLSDLRFKEKTFNIREDVDLPAE